MKKYNVSIEFTVVQNYTVMAEDEESAEEIALESEESLHYMKYDCSDYEYNILDVDEVKE